MTRNMSLGDWDKVGMFEREVALYRRLAERGLEIGIVTYGGESELSYADRLQGIKILCNQQNCRRFLYERSIWNIHSEWLRGSDVIKSNQTFGADIALRAARAFHKPMIARCGFMLSDTIRRSHGPYSLKTLYARWLESRVFPRADHVIVTTEAMKDDVLGRFPEVSSNISVIPNYVETNRFKPNPDTVKSTDVIFVGRFTEQKNPEALLKAIKKSGCSAVLIGKGPLKTALMEQYGTMNGRVSWHESVSNEKMPEYLNSARVLALPSRYEGNPKILLEAMSCALPVIGGDSPGINNVIDHGKNGWLCDLEDGSIAASIMQVLESYDQSVTVGHAARKFVEHNFSLERVVSDEMTIYKNLTGSNA